MNTRDWGKVAAQTDDLAGRQCLWLALELLWHVDRETAEQAIADARESATTSHEMPRFNWRSGDAGTT